MHRIELVGGPMDGYVFEVSHIQASFDFPQRSSSLMDSFTGYFHTYGFRKPQQPEESSAIMMDFQGTR